MYYNSPSEFDKTAHKILNQAARYKVINSENDVEILLCSDAFPASNPCALCTNSAVILGRRRAGVLYFGDVYSFSAISSAAYRDGKLSIVLGGGQVVEIAIATSAGQITSFVDHILGKRQSTNVETTPQPTPIIDNGTVSGTTHKKVRKGGGCLKVVLIVLLVFIVLVGVIVAISSRDSSADSSNQPVDVSESPTGSSSTPSFTGSNWSNQAQDSMQEILNQRYNGGNRLSYDWTHERSWFVDADYDYGEDDAYNSNAYTYGYFVCEGAFDYDVPGDGSSETVLVNYSGSVFIADNEDAETDGSEYIWIPRRIELTYDGVTIDTYENPDFFSD